jgi:hypothetical protein
MFKKIQLKLVKIKYSGKFIGNDIRIDIGVLDKASRVDKKIITGATVEFNKEIGSFLTDQEAFTAEIKITITEKDILFNDVGNVLKTVKVDANNTKLQVFTFNIELRENRFQKIWGKSVAVFEVTIEALATDAVKYIPDVDNGWFKVKILNGDLVSLPAYLKVQSEYFEKGREYFTILEGYYRGQKASVVLDNNNSLLLVEAEHKLPTQLQYSISKKKLVVGDKKYQVTDYFESPWEKGWYDIELPDYPHSGGRYYQNKASRAKTWFRIGHKGERYLHTGSRSLGCITIIEVEKWDEIYDKLIKARKGDFLSVGVLEVIN